VKKLEKGNKGIARLPVNFISAKSFFANAAESDLTEGNLPI
jgi:hypothetical protein